jgi:hypothetical protein
VFSFLLRVRLRLNTKETKDDTKNTKKSLIKPL